MIEAKFVERIAKEARVRPAQVAAAIPLFDKGASVPFVARYRKDMTQNLDEVALERIQERNAYFIALTNRRNAALENIEKQGKLSDELRTALEGVMDLTALDDLYLPFKKQRRTKASVAREQGLEPLADIIWAQREDGPSLQDAASGFIAPEKSVSSAEEALMGAQHILAERVSTDPFARQNLRKVMLEQGKLHSVGTKNAEGAPTKFEAYYDHTETLKAIPPHRLLAILRGVRMGLLRMEILLEDDAEIAELVKHYVVEEGSNFQSAVDVVVSDAYHRLLRPAMENEVMGLLRTQADDEAIQVFRDNTESLLMSPPAGSMVVLGVDPGLRSGCKLAVVDGTGAFIENTVIFPPTKEDEESEAEKLVLALIEKHAVAAIAIGNGTGSRDVGHFLRKVLEKHGKSGIISVYVNEAGASIYSASKVARAEFPDLDITVRGAISIARRLQDPLSELVKIDPKSIGVGQYQHDVNQRLLREALTKTIERCVNRVGVDLNTASAELLRYVSAIQQNTAENIVVFRTEHGPFKSRMQLLEVAGIGDKTFEQCAGFLRLREGDEPLDRTGIHPESYPVVQKIAETLQLSCAELSENREKLKEVEWSAFETEAVGRLTLSDIRAELSRPGRDPRAKFRAPKFLDSVRDVEALKEGMVLEGMVTNVTDFGAFVDIGVHQDGLIHLSEISNRYVSDVHRIVKPGDVVRVKVVKVDMERRRISLSRKALLTEHKPRQGGEKGQSARTSEAGKTEQGRRPARGDSQRPRGKEKRPPSPRRGKAPGSKRPERSPRHKPAEPEGMNTLLADQLAAMKDRFGK
jgi:protein Tex